MIPAFLNPINAIKKPIPAPTAIFKFLGIALITFLLNPVREMTKNSTPETSTAAKASCQEKPNVPTAVKVKKAFTPIPEAKPIG